MASVYISYNNGDDWAELAGGDDWPTSAGVHVVRKPIPAPVAGFADIVPIPRRFRIKVTSTDDDTWGIRKMELYTVPHKQLSDRA